MKVKCINNYLMRKFLTVDKVYEVELNEKRGYTIVDDTGKLFVYDSHRFEVVDNTPILTNFKLVRAIKPVVKGRRLAITTFSNYIVIEEANKSYFVVNALMRLQITNLNKNFVLIVERSSTIISQMSR